MSYIDFLKSKMVIAPETGFDIDESEINPALLPHQRAAVKWAVKGGRRALFEAFGLGKTVQELEWCRIVTAHNGGTALIIMPLGVRQEFTHDAVELLGRDATVTITHSKTKDVDRSGICVRADIVVGAAGLETPIRVFTRDYNGLIFDYGITKNADTGVLHGDIDCNCSVLCQCQTSVPGGRGLMVRAGLLLNIVDAYKWRRGLM